MKLPATLIFFSLILALLFCAHLSHNHNGEHGENVATLKTPPTSSTHMTRWRVLIYISADNNLEPSAVRSLQELFEVSCSSDISIAVYIDRSKKYARGLGDWSGARMLSCNIWANNGVWHVLRDVGTVDGSSAHTLNTFLDWASKELPAKHTLLALWGHGRGDRGFLYDEDSGGVMSVSSLGGAFKAHTFDIVALDMCSMQTLSMAAALAGHASVAVGSESTRHALGWSYADLIQALRNRPNQEPLDVAHWLTVNAGMRGGEYTGSTVALSRISALTASLNTMFTSLRPSNSNIVEHQLDRVPWISRSARTVDLGSLIETLSLLSPGPGSKAQDAYRQAVIEAVQSTAFLDATGLAIDLKTAILSINGGLADRVISRRLLVPWQWGHER